jgi:GT2 family glycosyltransferase
MTDFSIDVVMPVYGQSSYTNSILEDISNNSVVPKQIIIINNGSPDDTVEVVTSYKKDLPIRLLNFKKNIGVNAAWNLGMKLSKSSYVSVLNNDLVLNKYFFEVVCKTFELYPNCAMLCPKTSHRSFEEEDLSHYIEIIRNHTHCEASKTNWVPWRNGWAFTVRKNVVKDIIVPKELFNYCGDDYQFFTLKKLGHDILMMEQNLIFHYEGRTGKHTKLRDKMSDDTKKWKKIKEKLEL